MLSARRQDRDRSPRGGSAEPSGAANGKSSNGDVHRKGDDDAAGSGADDGGGGGGDRAGSDDDGGEKDAAMAEAPAEDPPAVSAEA